MSAIGFVLALIVLAYIGSVIDSSGLRTYSVWRARTPWLVLGILGGPIGFSIVQQETVITFRPVIEVALGWLAFVLGVRALRETRGIWRLFGIGLVLLIVLVLAIPPALEFLLPSFNPFTAAPWVGALALAAVAVGMEGEAAELRGHGQTAGPVKRLASSVARMSQLAALALLAFVVPLIHWHDANPNISIPGGVYGWIALTPLLGVVLGVTSVVLLGKGEEASSDRWGIVIGCALLGIGTSLRLHLSTVTVAFVAGVTITLLSPQRRWIRETIGKTEHLALVPVLVVTGVYLDPSDSLRGLGVVALVLVLRCTLLWVGGALSLAVFSPLRPAGLLAGVALWRTGALTLAVSLTLALSFPEPMRSTLILLSICTSLLGDGFGTRAFVNAMRRTGEIKPDAALTRAPNAETPPTNAAETSMGSTA